MWRARPLRVPNVIGLVWGHQEFIGQDLRRTYSVAVLGSLTRRRDNKQSMTIIHDFCRRPFGHTRSLRLLSSNSPQRQRLGESFRAIPVN